MPADIDPSTGYRRYRAAQVPCAHLIRRLRDLEMPLPQVRQVLTSPDVEARDAVISAHLEQMESALARTQQTVAALRSLLMRAPHAAIERRIVPATPVAVVREVVAWDDLEAWLADALASLHSR